MKRCEICGHDVRRQINCGRSELNCTERYSHYHYHCAEGCVCTYGGCMPDKVTDTGTMIVQDPR